MDALTYKPAKVAEAVGISMIEFRNWTRDGRDLVRREDGRLLSFRRSLQIAVAVALHSLGVTPNAAAKAAYAFTDLGEGSLPGRPEREPGEVFEGEGWTVLCVYPGDVIDVKYVELKKTLASELFFPPMYTQVEAMTLLNVTSLAQRLRARLEA